MTSLDSYVSLGRSGLRVSPVGLGTMTFGEDHGSVVNVSAAVAFGGMTVDGTTYPAFAINGKQRRGEY